MNILLTGGAGFIGSHIAESYIKKGHNLIIVDNLSRGKYENIQFIDKKSIFIKVDIKNVKRLLKEVDGMKIDVINHHAAQIDVRVSMEEPEKDVEENIIGVLNILELAKRKNVKHIIFASSAGTVYGECKGIKNLPDESSVPEPVSIYGVDKLAGEYYIKSFAYWNGVSYCILRYGNVYGPRQDPHGEAGVVAIFTGRILKNKPVFIFGDGRQLRDYVYVKDVAHANLLALNKKGVFNIGSGKTTSVNELADMLEKIHGRKIKRIYKPPRTGEILKSAFKIDRAIKKLGWKPETELYEGLKKTYEWFA